MKKFGIGQPVRRKEDLRLITGKGQYTDNCNLEGQYYAYFLRSPYPHAEILSIDTKEAEAAPGVIAVYTSEQVQGDDLGSLPFLMPVENADGTPMYSPPRHLLAVDRVRYVGEPIAMIIAESPTQAIEATDLVQADLKELPFNVDTAKSIEVGTPRVWPDCENNLCVHFEAGDSAAVEAAFEKAHTSVEIEIINNRLIPSAMEPRCCLGDYDPEKDRYTLYSPSQGAILQQRILGTFVFKKPLEHFRVISRDTGGSFGSRTEVYHEACLSLWAAKKLGHPVKWTGSRSEAFLTDTHGRDNVSHGALALDANGKILGLKVNTIANAGAHLAAIGVFVPTNGGGRITGTVYNIPAVHLTVKYAFTNTVPISAYRGAGRPEAAYLIERLLEVAAHQTGITSDEIRRRNFIKKEELPYTNFNNVKIKSGDFIGTHDKALKQADWDHFEQRRQQSAQQGKLRGIGIGYFVETSGGRPEEEARVCMEQDGSVTLVIGTYSQGQGHETAFSQILTDQLGIPFDHINFIQGDTNVVSFGGGTGGSRSSQMGGVAIVRACQALIEKGKTLVAHQWNVKSDQVKFENGSFIGKNAEGKMVSLTEVAMMAQDTKNLPEGLEPGLDITYRYDRGGGFTFPNGCHVVEVEVEPETGAIDIVRYTAVDDCGKVINPILVHGQVQGAIAQGLGQALLENTVYDPKSGQLLTGSYMDYCLPKAANIPPLKLSFNEVPQPDNDLGVKGAGESGSCGAPPAIVNAVLNALKGYNVQHLDMPLTQEKVWRAIQAAST